MKTTKPFKPQGAMALWVCTPFGFLAPSLRPHIPAGDNRDIQVRSRRNETLDALRERWLPELGENVKLAGTDYEWRAYCTAEQLAVALARMALAIDDPSFKALAEGPAGLADPELARDTHDMYMSVWSTVLKHGDGTSAYAWRGKGHLAVTGIEACRRWGHWWPPGCEVCKDCKEPNPNYPAEGPPDCFPPPAKTRARKTKAAKQNVPLLQP